MRMETALVLLAAVLATGAARAGGPGAALRSKTVARPAATPAEPAVAAPTTTFEILARTATATGDVATLLGALIDRCPEAERDLDRARCHAAQSYLRRTLPERSFSIAADDPAAISVSGYDPTLKGYRLVLAACVACTTAVPVGRAAQPYLITLKKPGQAAPADAPARDKAGDSLASAVEVATTTMAFPSEAEATRWLREVRPRLRAALIFRPAANEWRFRSSRGYALELVAGRIIDPCTGAVLLSSPPSSGEAAREASVGCPSVASATSATKGASAPAGDGDEPLPFELSHNAIAEAMGQIRGQIFACFQQHQVPGIAPLTYQVARNGLVQAVRLDGVLSGTPTGACLLDVARSAHFPRFDGPIQTFTYPFFLRR